MFKYKDVEIHFLGHSCFRINRGEDVIYIDPYKLSNKSEPADIILVSHCHPDHFSVEDIEKIEMEHTIDLVPGFCVGEMASNARIVKPGDKVNLRGISFEVVFAYNIDKFRSKGKVYHPKGKDNLGFVISIGDVKIYFVGDSDNIPEMKKIKCDIMLVPVSGKYVMDAKEAALAVDIVKPKIAVPMHYGDIIGDISDAETFKRLCDCKVEILCKEE
jgi:L-ascorbate metabolism protein UlaG (beta-lactamase superfamily)